MTGTWLVSFKGRKYSGAFNQNFLWNDGPLYFMDNHRAALWCWLQKLDLQGPHSTFHIDRHTDALASNMPAWLQHLPSWSADINTYLSTSWVGHSGQSVPVISWDNYLSIYLEVFGKHIDRLDFATHDKGDKPKFAATWEHKMWELPHNFSYWLGLSKHPWIVNVDLDYFFCPADDEEQSDLCMSSEAFVKTIMESLRREVDKGTVQVVTICMSPELTGGWKDSAKFTNKVAGWLKCDFKVPR